MRRLVPVVLLLRQMVQPLAQPRHAAVRVDDQPQVRDGPHVHEPARGHDLSPARALLAAAASRVVSRVAIASAAIAAAWHPST